MKVLLVDDSKAARFAMRNLLQKEGLEVELAESGEEALEKLAAEPMDMVFMDQSMPGMGGIEATRKITSGESTSKIPVVLCTGNEGDKLEEMAEEAGAIGVLTKPPQAEKLRAILQTLGGEAAAPVEEAAPEPVAATVTASADTESVVAKLLEQAITPLKATIEGLVSSAQSSEQSVMAKVKENVSSVEQKLGAQINKIASKDTGDYRIEFEELRQQLEGKLDNVHTQATQLAQNLSGETTRRAEAMINQRLGDLKDTVDQMEILVTTSAKNTEARLASMESGVLVKAAGMVVVMGIVLGAAGFFLLGK